MKTKLFFKMYSRTAVRLCYCGCLLLLFAACSKENYPQESDAPPHAATTKTWVIESADGSIKQTWSDAIQIPECNKVDFDGGDYDAPKADCRSYTHEGSTYYYYSWPYVDTYANRLCPSPWHVPSREDFVKLDVAFGGDGDDRYDPDYVMSYYKTLWGGVYGGYAHSTSVNTTGSNAYYWSSTADGSDNAYNLGFYTSGGVYPQYVNSKYYGFQVRCVK